MPEATTPHHRDLPLLGAVALGGVLGSLARYGIATAIPHDPGRFPTATFAVNVLGCLAIGILLVVTTELRTPHRLARPFLGTGVLGGFTTFSTYAVDTERLLRDHPATAMAYLFGTLAAALVAVGAGIAVTRRVLA